MCLILTNQRNHISIQFNICGPYLLYCEQSVVLFTSGRASLELPTLVAVVGGVIVENHANVALVAAPPCFSCCRHDAVTAVNLNHPHIYHVKIFF